MEIAWIFMIFDPVLPNVGAFLLVFAIVLGLLTNAKLFTNKNVSVAIAAAFGLFSAIYDPFVAGVQAYLPLAATLLVGVFFIVLLKKLFFGDEKNKKRDVFPLSIAIASLLIIIGTQWNRLQGFVPAAIDASTALWIVGIALVILIFGMAYSHNKSGGPVGTGPPQA